jgi:hypothetical protein
MHPMQFFWTTSNAPRTNYDEIRDYYFNFLQREPRVRNESRKIRIGCNVVTDVGVYSFTLKGPVPGTVATMKARYTFIYEQRDGAWLIVHHHSSAMPEPSQRRNRSQTRSCGLPSAQVATSCQAAQCAKVCRQGLGLL